MRILLVEDEPGMRNALVSIFKKNGYEIDAVDNGSDGFSYAQSEIYDVIILDIMLPRMNGLEVLRELRDQKINTPILMLTSKSSVADKVAGLDSGADDYLAKPFETSELLARIRCISRRKGDITGNTLDVNNMILDLKTGELSYGGNFISLGLKELSIMEMLMNHCNQIVTKETLIEKVWGYDAETNYNNVEVFVSFLRKKIAFLDAPVVIKTVRGQGYSIKHK